MHMRHFTCDLRLPSTFARRQLDSRIYLSMRFPRLDAGFTSEDLATLDAWLANHPRAGVVIVSRLPRGWWAQRRLQAVCDRHGVGLMVLPDGFPTGERAARASQLQRECAERTTAREMETI